MTPAELDHLEGFGCFLREQITHEECESLIALARWALQAREVVSALMNVPYELEPASIPKLGVEHAPEQVVGTLHIGWIKIKNARALLAAFPGEVA